ncbi:MAG: sugar ABC transporter substrate-binding protein [Otoolea sp.]
MKKCMAALLISAMVFGTMGCGSKQEAKAPAATEATETTQAAQETEAQAEPSAEGKQYEIAFSLKTVTNDSFQKSIADSIQKNVEAAGHKFTLATAGDETAVSTQVTQIEDLIAKKVDALIVNPMDANAVIPALQKAKDAGIPVVLVDSSIAEGNEDLYVTYVGTDNFNAAKIGAEKLTETLGGTGKVIIVRGANGNSVGDARVDGFKAGIGENIEIVGEQPGDWSNDVAKQVTENMLQANPEVDGIFTASDVMLDGILQAMEDAGREGIQIMSFDGSDDGKDLIKEGLVLGTMAQFPDEMGRVSVETLLGVLDGTVDPESVEKYIDSGTECITIDSLK